MKFAQHISTLFSPRWLIVCLFSFAATTILCWSVWIACAANRTWTGGTPGDPACSPPNSLWTNPCNWTSKVLPVAGDDLIFGSSLQSSSTNSFANGTTFNSISISAGHIMSGNNVSLNAGVTANNGQISLSSIKLNANQTFNAPTSGTGAVITSSIDNNAKLLTVDGPGNFTIVGAIGGSGGLTKTGSGTLILAGANAYNGTTTVHAGTLLVFGSQPQSKVSVGSLSASATIGGSGTVGQIVLAGINSNSISPGAANNGTGILTTNGNLTFFGTGTNFLRLDLNTATVGSGYDQLKVNGSLDVADGSLILTLGFTPAAGTTFTIIDNDGADAISGTFPGHPEGSIFTVNGATFSITYKGGDGNDVVLRVPETKTWSGAGANNNWTTAANWVGSSAPQLHDSLVFPAGAARTTNINDFPSGTSFNAILMSGGGYAISGNSIALDAGLTQDISSASANGSFDLSIKLNANQTFLSNTSGRTLTLNGPIDTNGKVLTIDGFGNFFFGTQAIISGTGGVIKKGSGLTILFANNTYTGATTVTAGVLELQGDQHNSAVNISGGFLDGVGVTGPISATGGNIEPGNVPNTIPKITVTGGLTLNSASTFTALVSGPAADQRFGQLDVLGAVNLGNANLAVFFQSSLPAGNAFTIINNDGSDSVNGTFNGLPEGSLFTVSGQQFRISYVGGDGNDVVLILPSSRTWSGGGATNNWSEGANWVGGFAPGPGDDLIFPAGAARLSTNNDFPSGTTFKSISFSAGGYVLNGNAIVLNNGINDSSASPFNQLFLTSITLGADQTFTKAAPTALSIRSDINTNGKRLTVDGGGQKSLRGVISGSGGLTVNGTGLVDTSSLATNPFSGTTTIHSGTYFLGANQPDSAVQIDGGTLTGRGIVKSVSATGGEIYSFSQLDITTNGNLTLNSNVTYRPEFISSIGKLNVGGSVNLANSTLDVDAKFISPPAGDSFIIINKTSAGTVPDTFKDLLEGATLMIKGFPFRISYTGGDGNDVVLTKAPPVLFTEAGTGNVAAIDSVTFVRSPFKILTDYNFSPDHHTRVVLITSNLGLTQPDPSVLTVRAAPAFPPEFSLEIENVGTLTAATNGIDCSYIVVRLPDSLPPGDYQLSFTLRGVNSNAAVLSISP